MAGLKIGISGDGVGRLASAIAHLLFMAFDGFSINAHFAPDCPRDSATVNLSDPAIAAGWTKR
jgi:hypothetical protein